MHTFKSKDWLLNHLLRKITCNLCHEKTSPIEGTPFEIKVDHMFDKTKSGKLKNPYGGIVCKSINPIL
jgi:hypothetical protein